MSSQRRRAPMTRFINEAMLDRTPNVASGLKPKRLDRPIPLMGLGAFWVGWLATDRRVSRSAMPANAMSGTVTRRGLLGPAGEVYTSAQTARCCTPPAPCTMATRFAIRASKFDCEVCALKMQCCPNGPSRQIPRDVHEYARDVVVPADADKSIPSSPRDERKRVEDALAHLKIHHGFERMRLRGLSGCARWITARCHCAEPQNLGAPHPRTTIRPAACIVT